MSERASCAMRYSGKSELVTAFLTVHGTLTRTIHSLCAEQGDRAFKNHAADALECLIGSSDRAPGPLDHLLGLRLQEYIALFGPMTFVKAVAAEYHMDFIVAEYSIDETASH